VGTYILFLSRRAFEWTPFPQIFYPGFSEVPSPVLAT
jgi:hypothetical protein